MFADGQRTLAGERIESQLHGIGYPSHGPGEIPRLCHCLFWCCWSFWPSAGRRGALTTLIALAANRGDQDGLDWMGQGSG